MILNQKLRTYSNKIPLKKSIQLVLLGLAATFVVAIVGSLVQSYLGLMDPNIDQTIERINTMPVWVLFPLILGPVFEEYIFRKLLLTRCMKRWPTFLSCCITSLVFAALHLNWFFFPFFLNSMIYSAIYLKTNRIAEASIVHILYNFTVLWIAFS